MAKILAIGIAVVDIINEVSAYPAEDSEIRALSQEIRRGGNASNSLVILSQLGHQCSWIGTYADDYNARIIIDDLHKYQIDHCHCTVYKNHTNPVSYIVMSKNNGSRSIVHYRDLPEYRFDDFKLVDLSDDDWIHFEGRNIKEVLKMQKLCREKYPGIKISTEIEKPREGIEQLIEHSDVVFFSKAYALANNFPNASELLKSKMKEKKEKILCCSWGEKGAYLAYQNKIIAQDAYIPDIVVDTLGAGDTFNAAMIDILLKGDSFEHQQLKDCLQYACYLSGKKCAKKGLKLA